ncbi:MAG: ClbS/DfsB family four-helix bundle protein [Chloroflexi bacterium]|nr:ClbS/DfsB family four-helix bundle protein [Chloroflexota bacterium]
MPRPTSKAQLLSVMQQEHDALEESLESLTPDQLTHVSKTAKWSIKDVLAHLLAWEQMCLGWYKAGLRGDVPPLPAAGYNWAQLPALNRAIFERYHDRPLAEVLKQYRALYRQTLKTVQGIDEADLFTPGRYRWTGKNALAAYFVGATSSHYAWARKEVRKCLKG